MENNSLFLCIDLDIAKEPSNEVSQKNILMHEYLLFFSTVTDMLYLFTKLFIIKPNTRKKSCHNRGLLWFEGKILVLSFYILTSFQNSQILAKYYKESPYTLLGFTKFFMFPFLLPLFLSSSLSTYTSYMHTQFPSVLLKNSFRHTISLP